MVNITKVNNFISALTNKFASKEHSHKTSDLTNDSGFLTSHQDISGKANSSDLAAVATSGSYNDLSNKPSIPTIPTLAELGGDIGVEKQQNAESGFLSTYHITQGGSKVGDSINIPKDFVFKSVSLETCTVADDPVTGFKVGEEYIDFVINVKEGTGNTEHLYLPTNNIGISYNADNSTLSLSNNQFSIKAGGVGTTQLSSAVLTSLSYADDYHNSAAAGITSSDITAWNNKGSSNLTTSDVDSEIEDYFDGVTSALNSAS